MTGGLGQVVLDESFPPSGLASSIRVTGFEDQTQTSGSWSLRAYAICAPPLPGLHSSFGNSGSGDSTPVKTATADCAAGQRVVGAGTALAGAEGQVVLDDVVPSDDLLTVGALAYEDEDGTAENWALQAYALCADPPPGLQLVVASSDGDSDPAFATASCPPGKNLLGTGGAIAGGEGQVLMDDVRPNAALTNVTVTGLEDENGHSIDWFMSAYAICANP